MTVSCCAERRSNVRRLEALRRAGLVERLVDGVWRVPADLPEQAREQDAQRLAGGSVTLQSHLPIEQLTHATGATWLDRQLISRATGIADKGFGGELREALDQRTGFLIEQGLAERRSARVVLARNLLATLRERELSSAGLALEQQTGKVWRPVRDGHIVSGFYRQGIQLASGRFALLDDGLGFTLVPWRPVIEKRMGQRLSAAVHGSSVTWHVGRQRELSR